MITHNLGYPRIGQYRELKKAIEGYWAGKITYDQLKEISAHLKRENWLLQKDSGIDLIPSNDFSLYDQVLDTAFTVDAIPPRYANLPRDNDQLKTDLYFAMARGYQGNGKDITAMEMTKWFDTNYHYIVPEFYKNQKFRLSNPKVIGEFIEAKELGILTKPVLLGPVSFLLLGKEKEDGFNRIDLLENLLATYFEILFGLSENGVEWIQLDEPCLVLDLTSEQKKAFKTAYSRIRQNFPSLKILLATYFGGLGDNSELTASLPVNAIHLDLARAPEQLEPMLDLIPENVKLSLGLVDGRNIWKNDLENSLKLINKAVEKIGQERLMIAPSCSLLHVPCNLDMETNEKALTPEIKQWLSFARQKLDEVAVTKVRRRNNFSSRIKLPFKAEKHRRLFTTKR